MQILQLDKAQTSIDECYPKGTMVDISTAMAAASVDGKKRDKKDGDKKGKSGRNHGIEPFDPQKYVYKEKADTASMWLILSFSLSVAIISRYLIMPKMDPTENHDILWFGPMALLLVIPSLHRLVLPERFVEHYTKGTWFKAGFLHVFAWLAFTFLLINPPLGDIGSPEPSAGWTIIVEQDDGWLMANDSTSGSSEIGWQLEDGEDKVAGTAWLMFALADNSDPNDADLEITITPAEGEARTLTLASEEWLRLESARAEGFANQTYAHDVTLSDHESDRVVAVQLGDDFAAGEYTITIHVTEEAEPWTNSAEWDWTFTVIAPLE